jgi:HK97 family phage prohead protease
MLHKSFRGHASVKSAPEGIAEVVVSAYGNVDSDGDIVVKGASSKQIAGEYGPNPKGLLDHDWSMKSAVAKTLSMWEEDDGLHIETQYNLEKEIGRDAFSDLLFYGDDMEFSVGYQVKRAVRPNDEQKTLGARRIIEEWVINEWSGVMLGANSDTHLVGAKSAATKALVGSYEYTTERICEALNAAFPSDWLYVRGTMPDKVIYQRGVETIDGYDSATFEVTYTDGPDGITFGDPSEVTVSEIVEPKAMQPDADEPVEHTFDMRAARFRLLVATTSY